MDTVGVIESCLIHVWTLWVSLRVALYMYGHCGCHCELPYTCMDTVGVIESCLIHVWTLWVSLKVALYMYGCH